MLAINKLLNNLPSLIIANKIIDFSGVFRQMWELWSIYSVESRFQYYFGNPNTLSQINSRILSIRPPEEIQRHPRPITERAKWKAFYSRYCTKRKFYK